MFSASKQRIETFYSPISTCYVRGSTSQLGPNHGDLTVLLHAAHWPLAKKVDTVDECSGSSGNNDEHVEVALPQTPQFWKSTISMLGWLRFCRLKGDYVSSAGLII